jgi:diadenylate cyclase
VRLVIGVIVLYGVYVAAQFFGLQLLSQVLQAGAVVGVVAVVVVFQPELRRALERIGRVGSLGWLFSPTVGSVERIARDVARAAIELAEQRHGALVVIERETGLEDAAETGVMLHADLSPELLLTIFTPRSPLHDGAVILRGDRVVAAGAVLPLAETTVHSERLGTRHRAALGITEQTDALAVVVSEETGSVALVERARIVRNMDEERLRTALVALLHAGDRARVILPISGTTRRPRSVRSRLVRRRGSSEPEARPTAPPTTPVPPAASPAPSAEHR